MKGESEILNSSYAAKAGLNSSTRAITLPRLCNAAASNGLKSSGQDGVSLRAIARHLLGLYHGAPGARAWRRMLSDAALLKTGDPELLRAALREVEPEAVADPA